MSMKEIQPTLAELRLRAATNSALGRNRVHINEHHGKLWVSAKPTQYTIETWYKGRLQGSLANLIQQA